MTVTKYKATEGRMVYDLLVFHGERASVYFVQNKKKRLKKEIGKLWKDWKNAMKKF